MMPLKLQKRLLVLGITATGLMIASTLRESSSVDARVAIQQVDSTDPSSLDTSTTSTSLVETTSTQVENIETTTSVANSLVKVDTTVAASNTRLSVTVSKSVVTHGETFTISVEASDPDGIDRVGFWLEVNGSQRDFCDQFMEMTTGTTTNGTWSKECTVPPAVIGGSYTVHPYASDSLRNLTESAERAAFTVEGGTNDSAGPNISSIALSKDVVLHGDTFTISINADDPSGVERVGFWFVFGGARGNDFCGQSTTQSAGASANGTWEYQCTVPASTPTGSYTVFSYAMDAVLNWTNNNCCTTSSSFATFTVAS
jgi:hypothetical protein